MELTDYQELASRTASQHPMMLRLAVAGLGLAGETAELIGEEDPTKLPLELGDVMWYVAEIATCLGLKLSSSDSNTIQYSKMSSYNLSNELVVQTGTLADYIKKVVGHGHALVPGKVQVCLDGIIQNLQWICHRQGIDFDTCLEQNIDKLRKRYPEGFSTIQSIHRVE